MASREQARAVADDIVADARAKDASQRVGRLHFFHGGLFTREDIERCGADKLLLQAALNHANKHWPIRLAALSVLVLAGASLALEVPAPVILILLVGGVLALRSLLRKRALEYMAAHAEQRVAQGDREPTQPPPA